VIGWKNSSRERTLIWHNSPSSTTPFTTSIDTSTASVSPISSPPTTSSIAPAGPSSVTAATGTSPARTEEQRRQAEIAIPVSIAGLLLIVGGGFCVSFRVKRWRAAQARARLEAEAAALREFERQDRGFQPWVPPRGGRAMTTTTIQGGGGGAGSSNMNSNSNSNSGSQGVDNGEGSSGGGGGLHDPGHQDPGPAELLASIPEHGAADPDVSIRPDLSTTFRV